MANLARLERQGKAIPVALARTIHITQRVAAVALTQWGLPVLGLPVAQVAQARRPQLRAAASHEQAAVAVEQHSREQPEALLALVGEEMERLASELTAEPGEPIPAGEAAEGTTLILLVKVTAAPEARG